MKKQYGNAAIALRRKKEQQWTEIMKTTLKRTVNAKERYYALELIANLFGEYLVIRTYGACTNAKPTRVISETYPTLNNAKEVMEEIFHEKQKRGYASAQH